LKVFFFFFVNIYALDKLFFYVVDMYENIEKEKRK